MYTNINDRCLTNEEIDICTVIQFIVCQRCNEEKLHLRSGIAARLFHPTLGSYSTTAGFRIHVWIKFSCRSSADRTTYTMNKVIEISHFNHKYLHPERNHKNLFHRYEFFYHQINWSIQWDWYNVVFHNQMSNQAIKIKEKKECLLS